MLKWECDGFWKSRLDALKNQWLMSVPAVNPQILEMFSDRDQPPWRKLWPWQGEFAGKYLTSLAWSCRLTGDAELKAHTGWFVKQLLSRQADTGYLGCFPSEYALTNRAPHNFDGPTWDAWSHYHIMYGLIQYHELTGDTKSLAAACKIADLIISIYGGNTAVKLAETGEAHTNQAPAHGILALYRHTGEPRYLAFGKQLIDEFSTENAGKKIGGDFFNAGLKHIPFYQTSLPRWESLHSLMALAEYYRITGEKDYFDAFASLWRSIRDYDRHNTGGFSSGEQATGNPYAPEAIENCCTIAWMELSVEMLLLSGNPVVADELEWSLMNTVLGMHSPSGRWATYNTPSNGVRRAAEDEIGFQARPGSPELNCCSVNSPKGYALLHRWAAVPIENGWNINFYGSGNWLLADGVTLKAVSDYPTAPEWTATLRLAKNIAPQKLAFRIPSWSKNTVFSINGKSFAATPGSYCTPAHNWQDGDVIEIIFDFIPRIWRGERECAGEISVYRGPVLLAADQRYNRHLAMIQCAEGPFALPPLGNWTLGKAVEWTDWLPPGQLWELTTGDGMRINLCDFASAGQTGSPYRSWLKV